LIASAQQDRLHIEAERYAAALIAVGTTTQFKQHDHVSHDAMATHLDALSDVVTFLKRHMHKAMDAPRAY
jgi:acetyl esterase